MSELAKNIRWRAVVLGWGVAIAAGVSFNLVFRVAHYGLFGGASLELSDTTALVTISVISGFLAHSVGGYVAGRGDFGGLNGAMVAVLGTAALFAAFLLIAAVALATAGALFADGSALPPLGEEMPDIATFAFVLFLVNLAGGFLGGKLGYLSSRKA